MLGPTASDPPPRLMLPPLLASVLPWTISEPSPDPPAAAVKFIVNGSARETMPGASMKRSRVAVAVSVGATVVPNCMSAPSRTSFPVIVRLLGSPLICRTAIAASPAAIVTACPVGAVNTASTTTRPLPLMLTGPAPAKFSVGPS